MLIGAIDRIVSTYNLQWVLAGQSVCYLIITDLFTYTSLVLRPLFHYFHHASASAL